MGYSSKVNSEKGGVRPKMSYATESLLPYWPRGVLAYAHINKLMIIAKRENHIHKTYNKQKR